MSLRSVQLLNASVYVLSPAILLSPNLFAQQPKVLAPHRPIAPRVEKRMPWPDPATERSMVGGLWMTDPTIKSAIYLKNVVETDSITVTPILWLSNGTRYTLPDVTLEPAGTGIVDINAGLQQKGISPWATLSGYVELQYTWPWDPICATVRNTDTAHSLIFTYGLQWFSSAQNRNPPAVAEEEHVVDGMWWKQESNVTGFVALANVSSQPTRATVLVTDGMGKGLLQHRVTVSPHGMKLVNLRELQLTISTSGGVRVSYTGPENTLLINGGLQDQSVGYSALLPFAMPQSSLSETPKASAMSLAELGIMTGAADPMMSFPSGTTFAPYSVLRNVSDALVSVTPTFWWMEGGAAHSSRLQQIRLLPHEAQSLDMKSLLSTSGLKDFNGSFNMTFDAETVPGALLLASGSVDQTNTYVFEVPPRSVGESAGKSLAYWSTGNGDDTMVTLWNPADEAQDLVFRLSFSGGRYALPIHLEPRATRAFSISEVIQNQIPDAEGNTIPAGVHEGSAKIVGRRADNENIVVAMESGIYNVRKATCDGTNCYTCDGWTGTSLLASPFGVAVGGQIQLNWTLTWSSGGQYNYNGSGTTWSSSSGAATVQTGLVHGVSPGSPQITTSNATTPVYVPYHCVNGYVPCPQGAGGGTNGTVLQLQSVLPNWGKVGTSPTVTLAGHGFGTAPTVVLGGTGITVSYTTRSDSSITATFSVASNAPVGFQSVQVKNNGISGDGGQNLSNALTFQVTPTSAVPVNFRMTTAQDAGNGELDVTYVWDSSTGNLNDLSACTIGENVTYPTPPGVDYQPPSPPWPANSPYINPTIVSGPATSTGFLDHHRLGAGLFTKPYSGSSFIANQYYWYQCSGGNFVHWKDGLVITRSVSTNGAGGWKFLVSTTDTSTTATINPLP